MRNLLLIVTATMVLAASLPAAAAEWLTDYDKAVKISQRTGKPILMDFTGSNWCGWCIKLKNEVFSTPAFEKWADKNVVLLELDFPRPDNQSEAIQKQNRGLLEKYEVRGFPTVVFTDYKGEVLGQYGYDRGGPENWAAKASEMLKN